MTKKDTDAVEETAAQNTKKHSRSKRALLIAVLICIVAVAALVVWLYTGSLTTAKQKIFSAVPLPIAIVEINPVSSVQLFERIALAEKILKGSGQNSVDISSQILDQLIETKKVDILARKNNLSVNDSEIDAAYQAVIKQFPEGGEEGLKKSLQENYGMDLNTFKNQAVKQSVLQDKLSKWFNEQESLNNEPYAKARELLQQLDSGTSFEDVANRYNQDPASQNFAGDSGFVASSDLLPEFQNGIKDIAINDKKLIVSRYGLHIIKVIAVEEKEIDGKKEKYYNLQQIFIKPNDFTKWFSEQSNNIRSVKLL